MTKVPLVLSWPFSVMPSLGVYEVYTHTADITPIGNVPSIATKVNELRGHSMVVAADPDQPIFVFIRFRNDADDTFSDWITGNFSVGGVAIRAAQSPLSFDGETLTLDFDAATLSVTDSSIGVKSGVFAARQSGAFTPAETGHDFGGTLDAASVEAALDALGERINELQAKLAAAGIGE